MRHSWLLTLLTLCFSAQLQAGQSIARACEALQNASFERATVVSTSWQEAQCNVTVRVRPPQSQSANSFIDVTVWMPDTANWNKRFIALGNGGYSPRLPVNAMAARIAEGFAVAASDTGHQSEQLDFVLAAPERIDFWGRTSVHVLNQYARKIMNAFYLQPAKYHYFAGCSTGGHQALTAAQYYPRDFDGIVAGAPGHNRVALNAAFLWLYQQSHAKPSGEAILSRDDLAVFNQFNLQSCDSLDGVDDGVIEQPGLCKPDYAALECSNDLPSQCLSANKIDRLKRILTGPTDPVTGEQIYPGFPVGSEFTGGYGWSAYWASPQNPSQPARSDFWRYWVFENKDWDPWQFDWHADIAFAKSKLSHRIDATKSNLSAFFAREGKLLLYHGMADPVVAFTDTVSYLELTKNASDWFGKPHGAPIQLYLIPGMSHCGGGHGLNTFDPFPALQKWVEQGVEPGRIPASRISDNDVITTRQIKSYSQ